MFFSLIIAQMGLKINLFYDIIETDIGKERNNDFVNCMHYLRIGLDILLWIAVEFFFAYERVLFCCIRYSFLCQYDIP